ncbi:hypothetical protein U9M48_018418 [Paspalum notatum var. saurae]|uniref:Uncharacterized protein n=1 Tax=Paspalum notatum var. saurae TaxID=547442 RepID=A0AAQ3TBR0_PASNO
MTSGTGFESMQVEAVSDRCQVGPDGSRRTPSVPQLPFGKALKMPSAIVSSGLYVWYGLFVAND